MEIFFLQVYTKKKRKYVHLLEEINRRVKMTRRIQHIQMGGMFTSINFHLDIAKCTVINKMALLKMKHVTIYVQWAKIYLQDIAVRLSCEIVLNNTFIKNKSIIFGPRNR
jgi:hypothetical protein